MRKIKLFSVLALVIATTLLMTSVVYAYAAYHGNWPEQPYWGNWWWYNYSDLYWYVDDCWTPSGADHLRARHYYYQREYRFEQEAYNPGAGTSCDRLSVYSVNAMRLPVTGYSILNGCGSSTVKELVHWNLNEYKINPNVWYRHLVVYKKLNPGSGGNGEVNCSFSYWGALWDRWLGKVVYDQWFNKKYSDPAGLVN